MALIRASMHVESTRRYGVPGDKQEGIDIFSKREGADRFINHQRKRERSFTPAKISKAVDVFVSGDMVGKTDEFVLCGIESFEPANRTLEIQKQRDRLANQGIKFVRQSFEKNRVFFYVIHIILYSTSTLSLYEAPFLKMAHCQFVES